MGNFKPLTKKINTRKQSSVRRSILRGSIGSDGENLPADLRLISKALSEAGLLSADASHDDVKQAITTAMQHIRQTMNSFDANDVLRVQLSPADDFELVMRRAIAEFRFPTAHRAIALSAAPRGARAIVDCGISIARQKLQRENQAGEKPTAFSRAILPSLLPNSHQSNRLLVKIHIDSEIEELDVLIADSIRNNGKEGFVEVRDFFSVLSAEGPQKALILGIKVKRRLQGKPRRRFIKLLRKVTPNEDDFDDKTS